MIGLRQAAGRGPCRLLPARANGRPLAWLAALACSAAGGQVAAPEAPAVTPYRPSVSTPAALSAPGYLEFEFGALKTPAPAQRESLPATMKLAFNEDWGIRVGADTWVRDRADPQAYRTGPGDATVVLKHRRAVDDASAFGIELGSTVPTGRSGVGAGSGAWSVNGIYSSDFGVYHLDTNLLAQRQDHCDPGVACVQTLWAAALSRPIHGDWAATGEFSGTRQGGMPQTSQFLLATAYTASRSLVIDAGLARSLRGGSAGASIFLGFTALGPRIF